MTHEGLSNLEADDLLSAYEQMITTVDVTFPKAHERIVKAMRQELLDRLTHVGKCNTAPFDDVSAEVESDG